MAALRHLPFRRSTINNVPTINYARAFSGVLKQKKLTEIAASWPPATTNILSHMLVHHTRHIISGPDNHRLKGPFPDARDRKPFLRTRTRPSGRSGMPMRF